MRAKKTTTIAALATSGTLALGGAFAFGAGDGPATASAAKRQAVPMNAGLGHGQGKGQGHGKGKGHGQGKGHGHRAGMGAGMGQAKGAGMGHGQGGQGQTVSAAKPKLTEAQRADLRYMREEEKLAHDVYTVLSAKYPDAPFAQIASSELRHASAVQRQLDRAGMADPTKGNAVGEFKNANLQKLYDTLVARGSTSLTEALKVGALIEETDIADLRQTTRITRDTQIKRVYSNLERASGQHLRIFVTELGAAGTTYQPTVLDQGDVDKILASSMR